MSVFSRRALLGSTLALIAAGATGAWAEAPRSALRPPSRPQRVHPGLRNTLDEILAEARLGGALSFAVMDLASGAVLESHNPYEALPPASVAKALTTLYALDGLDEGFRFETLLLGTGPIEAGVLKGDLVLVGSGDPLLQTDDLHAMIEGLKEAGVLRVEGRFLAHAASLPEILSIDPEQLPQQGYNPSISGLNLNFNRFCFEWAKVEGRWRLSVDARSDTRRPPVNVARVALSERAAPVFTYERQEGIDLWSVAQSALGKGGSRWLPVRDAAAYTLDVFQELAKAAGLPLPKGALIEEIPVGRVLARHQSPAAQEVMREMLKWSTNLTAEAMGLKTTRMAGGLPLTLAESAARLNGVLKDRYGVDVHLVDHSGLNDQNRISATEMVKLLAAAKDTPLRSLMKEHRLLDPEGNALAAPWLTARAKTGTLDFTSALAGYIQTQGGADLAFAIFSFEPEARARGKATREEVPQGARAWLGRAHRLQQALLQRWGALYPAPLPPL